MVWAPRMTRHRAWGLAAALVCLTGCAPVTFPIHEGGVNNPASGVSPSVPVQLDINPNVWFDVATQGETRHLMTRVIEESHLNPSHRILVIQEDSPLGRAIADSNCPSFPHGPFATVWEKPLSQTCNQETGIVTSTMVSFPALHAHIVLVRPSNDAQNMFGLTAFSSNIPVSISKDVLLYLNALTLGHELGHLDKTVLDPKTAPGVIATILQKDAPQALQHFLDRSPSDNEAPSDARALQIARKVAPDLSHRFEDAWRAARAVDALLDPNPEAHIVTAFMPQNLGTSDHLSFPTPEEANAALNRIRGNLKNYFDKNGLPLKGEQVLLNATRAFQEMVATHAFAADSWETRFLTNWTQGLLVGQNADGIPQIAFKNLGPPGWTQSPRLAAAGAPAQKGAGRSP